jgi:hypothetical protein
MKKLLILLSIVGCFVSCEMGLKELPLYSGTNILAFRLETYTIDTAKQKVIVTHLDASTISVVVDTTANTVIVAVTSEVDLTKLVGIATIDRAAKISPINGSPKLGTPGDFSKPNSYKVIAADQIHQKNWTITVHK